MSDTPDPTTGARPARRVLVTGASGRIGTGVVRSLTDAGDTVVALDRAGTPDPSGPSGGERLDGVERIEGDATDRAVVVRALDGVDAVVHLAAIPHPSLDTPFAVYAQNVVGTWAVLTAAVEAGIRRVVAASSINALGIPFNPHRPLPPYFPLDEDVPPDLADAYSLSKRSGELAAETAARAWGLSVVSFRFPLTADADALRHASARTTEAPETAVREGWSYLDVRDAGAACRAALESTHPDLDGRAVALHLGAEDTLIDAPTAALLDRWAPDVPRRRPLPGRAALVDTGRARRLIGFRPVHSVHSEHTADL
ncbi:nucleoside-diphosphate-sugar epimerase [Friedmanniella endophytica]|uniref:Nucleoside-diphosphate-sugar epimerase n=1 Tax=Microlunatus kandeliicorticis TaxID=1759536 RepID=A0A7W3IP06_9ACTN|nr:NAD(P)-dependent oxidoreductase [Microlunatus kandeliicorticis]MBA8792581.1 nucleoside-diphosphate-sugar epimerase [Microlunatus kandeliicorticis]